MGKAHRPPPPPPSKSKLRAASLDLSAGTSDNPYTTAEDLQRGGCRGGRALFSWDTVKADPQRNMYLGNSVKANVWRTARPSDWYTQRTLNPDADNGGEATKKEEEAVSKIIQKWGYVALSDLDKYRELLQAAETEGQRRPDENTNSKDKRRLDLKEQLRRERQSGTGS